MIYYSFNPNTKNCTNLKANQITIIVVITINKTFSYNVYQIYGDIQKANQITKIKDIKANKEGRQLACF